MNKSQAVERFREEILPGVLQQYGEGDKPAVREAWNAFADDIAKHVNPKAFRWTFPRELRRWA